MSKPLRLFVTVVWREVLWSLGGPTRSRQRQLAERRCPLPPCAWPDLMRGIRRCGVFDVFVSGALTDRSNLERPDDGYSDENDHAHQERQREAEACVIAKTIAARNLDHCVGLVPDGS